MGGRLLRFSVIIFKYCDTFFVFDSSWGHRLCNKGRALIYIYIYIYIDTHYHSSIIFLGFIANIDFLEH
jgi:hypothetical protein